MGETIRKKLVCTRIFLKTEKIYMLFQTTRIRVDMASHGTCCELYFSAKQRDLNGNRSYKEPLRQSPPRISPFDVWQRFLFFGGLSSWPCNCITNTQGEKSWCSPAWSIKTFSLLMTRGNKLFKRSAFNLTFLLSLPLSFVNRTHSSHCVSIIYIHYLRLFRRDCLFYHLLLACGFNETFTLMSSSSVFMFFFCFLFFFLPKNRQKRSNWFFFNLWEVYVLLGFEQRFQT